MSNSNNIHKRRNNLNTRKSVVIPGCIGICYVSLIHSSSLTAVNAFSLGGESIINKNNNKKCHGVACPRSRNNKKGRLGGRMPTSSSTARNSYASNRSSRNSLVGNNGKIKQNDHFALEMANYHHEQELNQQHEDEDDQQMHDLQSSTTEKSHNSNISFDSMTQDRRLFLASLFATTTATTAASTTSFSSPANAFEKAYPVNLDFDNEDTSINIQSLRQERIAVQKSQTKQVKSDLVSKPYFLRDEKEFIGSVVWGGALWLLLGSRSNPLVRPLANLLYDENSEDGAWVKDRNEGLFAPLPLAFTLIMGVVFLALGFITDRSLLFIAEGQSTVVLQLAGVSLIGGASLELGRIASGEKMLTREDLDREIMLADEFQEFASKLLIVGEGGSAHRSEVIRAFRRYYAKYRVENDEFPLSDLEIERLLRTWNKSFGNEEGLTSAGFLKGVKINEKAMIQ